MKSNIKRTGFGYCCIKCLAHNLNTRHAENHDCKKHLEKHGKMYKTLETPVGGASTQCSYAFKN